MAKYQIYRIDQTTEGPDKIVLARGLTEKEAKKANTPTKPSTLRTPRADYSKSVWGYEEDGK